MLLPPELGGFDAYAMLLAACLIEGHRVLTIGSNYIVLLYGQIVKEIYHRRHLERETGTYMHDQRIDIGCGYAGAIAIAAEGSLDLCAVHAVALEEAIQLGVVLGRVNDWPIGLVVAQKELGHVLAMT